MNISKYDFSNYIKVNDIEDINEYCISKAINKEYMSNDFFHELVNEFCNNKTKEYINSLKNAINFDLI